MVEKREGGAFWLEVNVEDFCAFDPTDAACLVRHTGGSIGELQAIGDDLHALIDEECPPSAFTRFVLDADPCEAVGGIRDLAPIHFDFFSKFTCGGLPLVCVV